jgi:hypothetical protein
MLSTLLINCHGTLADYPTTSCTRPDECRLAFREESPRAGDDERWANPQA